MTTIVKKIEELEDPRKYMKGELFDFMIDFINPEDGKEDETNIEIDMTCTGDYRDKIASYWTDFCKENNWNEEDIEVTDVWADSMFYMMTSLAANGISSKVLWKI